MFRQNVIHLYPIDRKNRKDQESNEYELKLETKMFRIHRLRTRIKYWTGPDILAPIIKCLFLVLLDWTIIASKFSHQSAYPKMFLAANVSWSIIRHELVNQMENELGNNNLDLTVNFKAKEPKIDHFPR